MKKKTAIILFLALLCAVVFPLAGAAADPFRIVVSSETCSPGRTAVVEIRLENNPGIMAATIEVSYDADKLSIVSAENGSVFQPCPMFVTSQTTEKNPYILSWNSVGDKNYTEDGVLATITFRMAEDAAIGDLASIRVKCKEMYGVNMNNLAHFYHYSPVPVEGTLTVVAPPFIPGDVNGDKSVDGKDGTLLLRYNAGWKVNIDMSAADVNADGKVDGKDATMLLRYNAGWKVVLKYKA